MPPPQFDRAKLKSNEFLCRKGSEVSVHKLDLDKKPTSDTLSAYYCLSSTNVPFEILNTGNVDVIKSYLTEHGSELSEPEKSHLNDRLVVMDYFSELENYYRNTPRTSVQPMTVINGKKVLPGVVLDRKQDTTLGCWSCAFSMLLKGRGVDVDQELIRRYRPEFVEGHEVIAAKQTDIINSNSMSEIYQYSSLVDKVCPNTKMCKMNKGRHGATSDNILTEIKRTLREKNAPVAFCNGFHWTTIVGISDDGEKFYVVNSENTQAGQIDTVPVKQYLDNSSAEFVWLEDIVLDMDGKSKALPENRFHVDKGTGSVTYNLGKGAERGASSMSTLGNHVLDETAHMEYYVPNMIRDYSISYEEQKEQSDKYLKANGGYVPPEPVKKPKYTKTSDYSRQAVIQRLNIQLQTNVFSDRKTFMRGKYFNQLDLDQMSVETVDACYKYIKENPNCKEVPLELWLPEYAAWENAGGIQNDNNPPAEEEKQEAVSAEEKKQETAPVGEKQDTVPVSSSVNQAEEGNEFTLFGEGEEQEAVSAVGEKQDTVPVSSSVNQEDKEFTLFEEGEEQEAVPVEEKKQEAVSAGSSVNQAEEGNEFTLFEEDEEQKASKDSSLKAESSAEQGGNEKPVINDAEPKTEAESRDIPAVGPVKEPTNNESHDAAEQTQPEEEAEVQPQTAKTDAERQEETSPSVKSSPEEEARETETFANLGRILEEAKTVVNSKQYTVLTNTVKMLGNEKQAGSLSPEERVQLMAYAGATVGEYISHKSKDGVKPNVLRKLAAVEAVSKYLDRKLEPYRDRTFTFNKKQIRVADIALSFEAQYNSANEAARDGFSRLSAINPLGYKLDAFRNPDNMRLAKLANTCMNKIVLDAVSNNRPDIQKLDIMRSRFADEKFVQNELSSKKKKDPPKKEAGGLHR